LKIIAVGEQGADIKFVGATIDGFSQVVTIVHGGRTYKVRLPLVGAFQVQNAGIAAGLTIATGAEPSRAFAAMEQLVGAKGRLELAGTHNDAPIFIDYAHKPDALKKALESLRPYARGGSSSLAPVGTVTPASARSWAGSRPRMPTGSS
jgi:UDP-N-acetylmuramoyl-L-alanyl-D-glutamate--2,6-diaminopimelate ligase